MCGSPGEWRKFHNEAVAAVGKDVGSTIGTWGGVLCVCGEWLWPFGASPHSQAACSVPHGPPADFSFEPPLEWAPMESWRGSAHLWAQIGLMSLSAENKICLMEWKQIKRLQCKSLSFAWCTAFQNESVSMSCWTEPTGTAKMCSCFYQNQFWHLVLVQIWAVTYIKVNNFCTCLQLFSLVLTLHNSSHWAVKKM